MTTTSKPGRIARLCAFISEWHSALTGAGSALWDGAEHAERI